MACPIDPLQLTKAVAALERHLTVEKQAKKSATSMTEKSALFGDDGLALDGSDADHFQLVIGLHKIHAKTKPTPERIPIPHSMRGEGAQLDVCLFAKDPESEWKSVVEEKGLGKIVTKVIGVTKLRKEFKSHEAKRQLCDSYDFFLADDRVLPALPKVLGKAFFQKKKLPSAINMKKTDLMKEVRTALDATYYYQSNASSVSIKVATTQQPFAHVVANAMAVAEKLVAKHIPGRWANIRMVGIKTRHSVTLPVYNNVADVENDDAVPVAAQGAGTTAKAAIVNDVTELQGKLADDTLTEAQRAKLKRKLEQAESKQEVRSFLKDLSKKIKLKGVVL